MCLVGEAQTPVKHFNTEALYSDMTDCLKEINCHKQSTCLQPEFETIIVFVISILFLVMLLLFAIFKTTCCLVTE